MNEVIKDTQDTFFKTTPNKIDFQPLCIFSERFLELLIETLGTAEEFKKKTGTNKSYWLKKSKD